MVSTTNDPATPYQAGVDLARQLGGTLLTFEGTQHTVVFQGNTCIDDIAARYLVDVTVPPAGHPMLTISVVGEADLPELMPMLRGYCDFYEVDPPDEKLGALSRAR